MFAALTTIEPPVFDRDLLMILERDATWYEQRLATLESRIHQRLADLLPRPADPHVARQPPATGRASIRRR